MTKAERAKKLPLSNSFFFFNCMFYQLLCVQHSCSSTQSWGSVLPVIVETTGLILGVALCSLCIGIWDLFVHRGQKSYTPTAFGKFLDHSRSKMHETCLIIIYDPGIRLGPGIEPGTFGLADECSTIELTLFPYIV